VHNSQLSREHVNKSVSQYGRLIPAPQYTTCVKPAVTGLGLKLTSATPGRSGSNTYCMDLTAAPQVPGGTACSRFDLRKIEIDISEWCHPLPMTSEAARFAALSRTLQVATAGMPTPCLRSNDAPRPDVPWGGRGAHGLQQYKDGGNLPILSQLFQSGAQGEHCKEHAKIRANCICRLSDPASNCPAHAWESPDHHRSLHVAPTRC
jgi:hypothetical protein